MRCDARLSWTTPSLTFDKETKGAIVLEHLDDLNASIRRWLEKNMAYIEFVVPIEKALVK